MLAGEGESFPLFDRPPAVTSPPYQAPSVPADRPTSHRSWTGAAVLSGAGRIPGPINVPATFLSSATTSVTETAHAECGASTLLMGANRSISPK